MLYYLRESENIVFSSMYPFWSFVFSIVIAQLMKPVIVYFKTKSFNPKLIFSSGGMPSSHTAGVFALCLSVGLQDSFNSTTFAVALALGCIVAYDAANVRYYAGKNIQLTKQIVKDLKNDEDIVLDASIYNENIKDILGHKWSEVIGGTILGLIVSLIFYLF